MARKQDWEREIHDGLRREPWSLTGPDTVVKVIGDPAASATALGGYITVGRYLVGKTPAQLEFALGLPSGHLARGCSIFRFRRLPLASEYDYELTAEYPGGLAYNPVHFDPRYMPGAPYIHQWCIKPNVSIPVDPTNVLRLHPGQLFPYDWL